MQNVGELGSWVGRFGGNQRSADDLGELFAFFLQRIDAFGGKQFRRRSRSNQLPRDVTSESCIRQGINNAANSRCEVEHPFFDVFAFMP